MSFRLLASLLTILLFSSFSDINKKVLPKNMQKKYAYVPSRKVTIAKEELSVAGFFMMKSEVSNLDYREFLAYLKREGRTTDLKIAQVNNEGWKIDGAFMEPYVKTYASHSAYDDYPVVNITKQAAELYCEFLKESINKNNSLKGYKIKEVRLPLKAEWIMAAKAGRDLAPYPWGGYYLRNAKGCVLANFKGMGSENITKNYTTGKLEVVKDVVVSHTNYQSTLPVFSFFPNDFDLYNMSGNVAEMIADKNVAMGGSWNSTGFDIRIESEMPLNEFSCEIGFRPIFIIERLN